MTAAAARAKAVGIPRGRLVAQAALVVFLSGGIWVVVAGHIAEAVGRCLAVEGSVWAADERCRYMMAYPPAVAVVSILLMLVLCVREAQAESKVRKAGGGAQAAYLYLPEVGVAVAVAPESRHLRESDAMALGVMIMIYLYCLMVLVLGLVVRNAGSRRQLKDAADQGAAALTEAGSAITLAGCLALCFECCCIIIPYVLLKLRRFVRANWVVSAVGMTH